MNENKESAEERMKQYNKQNSGKYAPLLGTLELALFLPAAPSRFPPDAVLAIKSILIPAGLLFLWMYPLYVVPTDVMGERGYFELVFFHLSVLVIHLVLFLIILWKILIYLKKSEFFWLLITMNNFSSLIGFAVCAPMLIMVVKGIHSWDDVVFLLIAVSVYEFAIISYCYARALTIPWQLAVGIGFIFMFARDISWSILAKLFGI